MQVGMSKYDLVGSGKGKTLTIRKAYNDSREVAGATNGFNADGILPILFGTTNIAPFLQQQVTPTISFNRSRAIYALAFAIGYTDIALGGVKIGSSPLNSVGAVVFSELVNDSTIPANEQVIVYNQTLKYDENSAFYKTTTIISTSQSGCNQVRILFSFSSGLYKDVFEPNSYTIRVEYKLHNQDDSHYAALPGYTADYTFTETNKSLFYKEVSAVLPEGRYNTRLQVLNQQNFQDIEGKGEHGEPTLWAICYKYAAPAISNIAKTATTRYQVSFLLPNELSETAGSISLLAQKKWQVWNGSAWVMDTTSNIALTAGGIPEQGNPASAILYMLTSPDTLGKRAMPSSIIDLDSLGMVYAFAATHGLFYNKYLSDIRTANDQLYRIAAACGAYPYINDAGKIAFVVDKERAVAFVAFPRIVLKDSLSVNLIRRDEARYDVASVSFVDNDLDANVNTGIIWYDQSLQGNPIDSLNYKAITYDINQFEGVTNREQLWRSVRRYLTSNNQSTFTCDLSLDVRGSLVNLLDRIAIQHPDFDNYCVSGDISTIAGTTITVDLIDVPASIDASTGFTDRDMALPQTHIMLLSAIGSEVLEVASISGNIIITKESATVYDADGVNYFSLGGLPVDAMVTDIVYSDKHNVALTCTNYLPALYAVDTETVPAYTEYDKLPVIAATGLSCDYSLTNPYQIPLGKTGAVVIYLQPNGAKYVVLSATSSSPTNATASAAISVVNVTGVAVGDSTITVSDTFGHSVTFKVSVYVPVTKIVLTTSSTALDYKGTSVLTATITPSNATNQNMNWYNNNTDAIALTDIPTVYDSASGAYVATTDNIATAVAANNGQSRIYVKSSDGGFLAWVDIAVIITPTKVTIEDVLIQVDDYITISPSFLPSSVMDERGTWSITTTPATYISFEGLVNPDNQVTIRGVTPGDTTVRFTHSNGVYVDFLVHCVAALTGLELVNSPLTVWASQKGIMAYSPIPANASLKSANWSLASDSASEDSSKISLTANTTNNDFPAQQCVVSGSTPTATGVSGYDPVHTPVVVHLQATDELDNVHYGTASVVVKQPVTITGVKMQGRHSQDIFYPTRIESDLYSVSFSPLVHDEGKYSSSYEPICKYDAYYDDKTPYSLGSSLPHASSGGAGLTIDWNPEKLDQGITFNVWPQRKYADKTNYPTADTSFTVNYSQIQNAVTISAPSGHNGTIYANSPDNVAHPGHLVLTADIQDTAHTRFIDWSSSDPNVASVKVLHTGSDPWSNNTAVVSAGNRSGTADITCTIRYDGGTHVTSNVNTVTVKQFLTGGRIAAWKGDASASTPDLNHHVFVKELSPADCDGTYEVNYYYRGNLIHTQPGLVDASGKPDCGEIVVSYATLSGSGIVIDDTTINDCTVSLDIKAPV